MLNNKRKNLDFKKETLNNLLEPYSGFSIEMRGRQDLTVRGCKKIEKYTPTLITLSTKCGYFNIAGCGLGCFSYSRNDIGISGKIRCMFFSEKLSGGQK